jgi:hypothetical protein
MNDTSCSTRCGPKLFERFSTVTATAGVSFSVNGLRVVLAGDGMTGQL